MQHLSANCHRENINDAVCVTLVRQIGLQKRLELTVRDFVVTATGLSGEQAKAIMASPRSPVQGSKLSEREITVLRMLAKAETTVSIAKTLNISRTTVHNHIQHILQKLNAHSRLEAIRLAEHARLI